MAGRKRRPAGKSGAANYFRSRNGGSYGNSASQGEYNSGTNADGAGGNEIRSEHSLEQVTDRRTGQSRYVLKKREQKQFQYGNGFSKGQAAGQTGSEAAAGKGGFGDASTGREDAAGSGAAGRYRRSIFRNAVYSGRNADQRREESVEDTNPAGDITEASLDKAHDVEATVRRHIWGHKANKRQRNNSRRSPSDRYDSLFAGERNRETEPGLFSEEKYGGGNAASAADIRKSGNVSYDAGRRKRKPDSGSTGELKTSLHSRNGIYGTAKLDGQNIWKQELNASNASKNAAAGGISLNNAVSDAADAGEKSRTARKKAQKRLQKQRIKRRYAKARRQGEEKAAEAAFGATKKAGEATARKLQEYARKHAGVIACICAFLVLFLIIMSGLSSCGATFSDMDSIVMASAFQSKPQEIDAADLQMTKLETELQEQIDSIEDDYPDYDEYDYNLGEIGHNPYTLISFLSAEHTEFTATEVESEIQDLFDSMYTLTLTPDEETRTRTVTVTDPDTGDETEEEEEYTVKILRVTLTVKSLEELTAGMMDSEQTDVYSAYIECGGLLQNFDSPVNLYWYNYVSSYYGYRINSQTGEQEFHRGIDISIPEGSEVRAGHDGIVEETGSDETFGNYVVIGYDGYTTKYAHLGTVTVTSGQSVQKDSVIGSSGEMLHIECMYNGEYYNPLFYFEAGDETLYGESAAGRGTVTAGDGTPPESFDDETVQALMDEAAKYVGRAYVWGGSTPETGFDCSGFVTWCYNASGAASFGRTTAQGIYNLCTPVSASEAKAGDIIFFTGTYNSGTPVSHVGIYCGNGVMVHAGDPIKYSNINTSYWQSHLYGFGRISN